MKLQLIILSVFSTFLGLAQNNVGINTSTPDSSAILHLESNDKGFLPPRLTENERNSVNNPATGLVIYNTTDSLVEYYNGNCWVPSFEDGCTSCEVNLQYAQSTYQIDRNNTLNLQIPITTQTSVNPSPDLDMAFVHDFSDETIVILERDSLNTTGLLNLSLETNVFETAGNHFVTIFTTCGSNISIETIKFEISTCDEVILNVDQTDYDLSSAVSGNNCVAVYINENIGIRSSSVATPAFTTGGLNVNIGIENNGYIYGKGGDGPLLMGQNGEDGGDAIEITCPTEIRNKGMIYGGGGSGLTVGAFQQSTIGPINLCIAAGAGGGGGMPSGIGGGSPQQTCSIVIGIWENGNGAGINYDDNEGSAVNKTQAFNIPTPIVSGTIVMTVNGGAGGDFGEPGTSSAQPIDFSGSELNITVNIPFIGDVSVPIPLGPILNPISNSINNGVNNSIPGVGGKAIKHNGNAINILDGDYQTYWLRGAVGN